MVTNIGIRELQQHASRLVREVEQGQAEYRVTVQGRDTGVTLARSDSQPRTSGATMAQVLASDLWQYGMPDEARRSLLARIEAGREAMGYIGE